MGDSPPYADSNGDTGDGTGVGPGRGSATGSPRWVTVSWIIGVVLVLLLAVMLIRGHGPGRHMHGGLGDHTPVSSITAHGGQPS